MEQLKKNYSHIFESELLEEIAQIGTLKNIEAGEVLIELGNYLKSMPLLLSGVVKVMREDESGGELLLYFLEKGDTCAMSLSCCMGETSSQIRAVAETDTTLVMVPIQKMEEWLGKYKSWRDFVISSYHNRLMETMETIDNIAFYNMDERLLKYLEEKMKVTQSPIIQNTHQEIALELNTSRVVISRLLKKLENLGKVILNRNSIEVLTK